MHQYHIIIIYLRGSTWAELQANVLYNAVINIAHNHHNGRPGWPCRLFNERSSIHIRVLPPVHSPSLKDNSKLQL